MKISNREKVLLILLGLIVIVFVYYRFAFTPQWNARTDAIAKEEKKKQELVTLQDNIVVMKSKEKKLDALQKDLKAISKNLYVNLIQEEEIREIDRLLVANNLESLSINFSPKKNNEAAKSSQKKSTTADKQIEQYKTIALNFKGKYADFQKFVAQVQKNQRIIKLYDLQWSADTTGVINGSVNIDLYITPALKAEEKKYIEFK